MPVTIARESPTTPDGHALIAGSDAALREFFPAHEIFSLDPSELAVPEARFFVARQAGVAIGCVALLACDGYAEVKRLYVSAAGRGKGNARALMARLEAEALADGFILIRLETGPALHPAVALYQSLGYQTCARFGAYEDIPASLFMAKTLTRQAAE